MFVASERNMLKCHYKAQEQHVLFLVALTTRWKVFGLKKSATYRDIRLKQIAPVRDWIFIAFQKKKKLSKECKLISHILK